MLSSHEGAFNSCLRLLQRRGYSLALQGEPDADGNPIPGELLWIARKDGYEFKADNPIELLGLCSLQIELAPTGPPVSRWWVIPGEDLVRSLVLSAFPESNGSL